MTRMVRKQATVNAPRAEVWKAWTTSEGARTFFAPDAKIELRHMGPYEIYFDLDEAPGLRGSEDCHVLAWLPEEMLAFSWSAPPHLPAVRQERSFVVVQLAEADEQRTRATITQLGFGEGEEWDACFTYFDRAWGLVMSWLERRFIEGPLDWSKI